MWPTLQALFDAQRIGLVDLLLAEHLLPNCEASAAFICHLSAASRVGHLCVTLIDDRLFPSPEEIWISKNGNELDLNENLLPQLTSLIVQGARLLAQKETSQFTPIYRDGNAFYFQRNWVLQERFLKWYQQRLSDATPRLEVDKAKIDSRLEEMKKAEVLFEEQAEAIARAAEKCVTLIIGGPGTGKTYTASLLIRTLWECFDAETKKRCKIAVTAPTGKAASHLAGKISDALRHMVDPPKIETQTLHALLGVKERRQLDRHLYCDADIVLVDECSMIDVWMMGDLMGSLKQGTRLILLGDPAQLPAVESGSLFADLATFHREESQNEKRISELKRCQRTELKEIVACANHIYNGNAEGVLALLSWDQKGGPLSAVTCDTRTTPFQTQQSLIKAACTRFSLLGRCTEETPLELMYRFSQFRVLSPLREGPFGVDELNKKIFQACLQAAHKQTHLAIPVLITKNDYRMNLFNGDMGILIQPIGEQEGDVFAYFADRSDEKGFRTLHAAVLPPYEYAYCLSIHKSQGSEFDSLLLVIPSGAELFGREALYTAVTRAKASFEIWTTREILSKMIAKQTKRCSGIIEKLKRAFEYA